VHENVLQQFRARGFIGPDTLRIIRARDGFLLEGEIACLGGIIVRVAKFLCIVGSRDDVDPLIRTDWYSYNVKVHGWPHNAFRYDNQHPEYRYPGHVDEHHKHTYDDEGQPIEGSPMWVGAEHWPTLGEVIAEAELWYYEHRDRLKLAEAFPPIRHWGAKD
jgi:hypothetical protein